MGVAQATHRIVAERGAPASAEMMPATLPAQDLNSLYTEFLQLAGAETDRSRFLMSLVQRVVGITGALGGVFFVRDEDDDLAFGPRVVSRELLEHHPGINPRLAELARAAVGRRQASTEVLDEGSNLHAVVVPVQFPDSGSEVCCLVVRSRDLQPFVALLQLACGYVNFWRQARHTEQLDFEAGASASMIELVTRVQQADDADDACLMLANELAAYFGADRVAVGMLRGVSGQCRLRAMSETSRFDHRNKLAHALEGVFSEAGGIGEPSAWPAAEDFRANALMAHRKLHNLTGAMTVLSAPMHDSNDRLVAVAVLWWMEQAPDMERCRRSLAALDQPLGACMALHGRATRRGIGASGGSRTFRNIAIGLSMVAAVGVLAVPSAHRIKAGVLVSPVNQRVVSAPFAGIVETSEAAVGDVVAAEEVLARFDGREFSWRADELLTEYDRLGKKRDVALADGDASEAQIAELEMRRTELKIELLENQMRQLEIRAPISGVVLADALDQREGSPVDKGQALYEIAPLDRLYAEVEIPVADISHVTTGMSVELGVDAFPDRVWRVELVDVLPRAEIRDGRSVFVSRVPLEDGIQGPMPGMRGDARLYAGERALGWVLFHRPWERLRKWLGWVEDVSPGELALHVPTGSETMEPATLSAPGVGDVSPTSGTAEGLRAWWATFIERLRVMREKPSGIDYGPADREPDDSG